MRSTYILKRLMPYLIKHRIQASLEQLSKGRTVITIAHRLTSIQNADKIMVLTKNGIEETGSHNELMDKRGIYYNMYTAARRDIND